MSLTMSNSVCVCTYTIIFYIILDTNAYRQCSDCLRWCWPWKASVLLLPWLSGRCPLLLQLWLSQFQSYKWWTHHCGTCHHWKRDEQYIQKAWEYCMYTHTHTETQWHIHMSTWAHTHVHTGEESGTRSPQGKTQSSANSRPCMKRNKYKLIGHSDVFFYLIQGLRISLLQAFLGEWLHTYTCAHGYDTALK